GSPDARPIAGATDLLVHWPDQQTTLTGTLVDLSRIDALRGHRWTDDELVLGALTTYWDIITDPRAGDELPILPRAARTVGAVQIQTRGTWAGNIANASPAADGVPALMALDADVETAGENGTDRVPLDAFYLGYKQLNMQPGRIITAIRVPRRRYGFSSFIKVGTRNAQAIAKVGTAITHSDAGWRVVANSMAPTVRRCRALEDALDRRTPIARPEDFIPLLEQDLAPIDDIRSTAAYRMNVLARVLFHALAPECPFIGTTSGRNAP
ncbi:MAG TPA: xanthine dehydrogenase family protein subunit M, partial [Phycisphaerales bacterium]|nr:xanthine dehydrogenase family protein subunit M [Phycisphaerales bacterium]